MHEEIFSPSFGNRPSSLVGRERLLNQIETGLQSRPGSREPWCSWASEAVARPFYFGSLPIACGNRDSPWHRPPSFPKACLSAFLRR